MSKVTKASSFKLEQPVAVIIEFIVSVVEPTAVNAADGTTKEPTPAVMVTVPELPVPVLAPDSV